MKKILFTAVICLFIALSASTPGYYNKGVELRTTKAAMGPMMVWSSYEGRIEAKRAVRIMSAFMGDAIVMYIAPDGSRLAKGSVMVRFESSALEREIPKLKSNAAIAQAELESLTKAKIPLAVKGYETKLAQARSKLQAEERYYEVISEFQSEGVISEAELIQQREKVKEAQSEVANMETEMKLTTGHLHPSEVRQAALKLEEARRELSLAQHQLESAVIHAPADGVVVYVPMYFDGDFRVIRAGDTVRGGQAFMALTNMNELVAHVMIPETEYENAKEFNDVLIKPYAFPDKELRGRVEYVGSSAMQAPESRVMDNRKFFHVVVSINGLLPDIKPGMTATVSILAYNNPRTLLLKRGAVNWINGEPHVKVYTDGSWSERRIHVGMANDMNYEVTSGLKPGELALMQ